MHCIRFHNNKVLQTYYPGQKLRFNKIMVFWRVCLFRQYIRKKHKYAIYTLYKSNGLVLKTVEIYYIGTLQTSRRNTHPSIAKENLKRKIYSKLVLDQWYADSKMKR